MAAEEIAFENGRISNFQGHVTLTTLDRVILALHTIVHNSSNYLGLHAKLH